MVGVMAGAMDWARGRKLFVAMARAVAERALTIEELALEVGCTPHEAIAVLLKFDHDNAVTVTVAARGAVADDIVVRPSRSPGDDLAPKQ
jgi:hypothetical protein